METAEKVDWATLNVHAAGRPARRLVSKAIAAAGGDRAAGVVLDLGAGAGAGVGALTGGNAGTGALIGGALGAVGGTATTPERPPPA